MSANAKLFTPSEVLRAQDAFFLDLARLRLRVAAEHPDWLITVAEAGVQVERNGKIRDASGKLSPATYTFVDRVHMVDSHHYERLAADLNLFVPVEGAGAANPTLRLYRQVVSSDAPEYAYLRGLWLELSDLNRVMPSHSADANHFARAVGHGDKRI